MGACCSAANIDRSCEFKTIDFQAYKGKLQQGVKELRHVYEIEEQTLSYAENTYRAISLFDPDYQVAIKVFNKTRFNEEELDEMRNEISSLCNLDHPKIVKYLETYDDHRFTYLVMEYVEGIALYDKIAMQQNGNFSEG